MYDDDIGISANRKPQEFNPCVFYNKDGDMLEVYWSNEADYGKPFDNMCLMLAMDGNSPVGVQVNCLKRVLREAGYELVPIKEEKDG